jgi:glutamyl-tRNA reductase
VTSQPVRRVLALTTHARDVPAVERERFATALQAALPAGSILLVTCHRVEAYVATETDDLLPTIDIDMPAGAQILAGEDATHHVLSVAVGRDSVVLGEDEILHQLREALGTSRATGALDPTIDRLFTLALRAGRRARSWQQGRRRSLGDVAVDAIERVSGPVAGGRVLVVGAGKMGALAARSAARSGASVLIANRSPERARALADAVGGQAAALDPGSDLASVAGVIVALSGPWQLEQAASSALVEGGAIVVDLSFPSAVPEAIGIRLGDRLVTADQLALEDPGAVRPDAASATAATAAAPAARLDALVDRSVREFVDWQARGDGRAAADALVRRADREREIELDALFRRIPTLEPEAREAIEGMTRHLAARLLQQPLERLGRDRDGRDGKLIRDLFAL